MEVSCHDLACVFSFIAITITITTTITISQFILCTDISETGTNLILSSLVILLGHNHLVRSESGCFLILRLIQCSSYSLFDSVVLTLNSHDKLCTPRSGVLRHGPPHLSVFPKFLVDSWKIVYFNRISTAPSPVTYHPQIILREHPWPLGLKHILTHKHHPCHLPATRPTVKHFLHLRCLIFESSFRDFCKVSHLSLAPRHSLLSQTSSASPANIRFLHKSHQRLPFTHTQPNV